MAKYCEEILGDYLLKRPLDNVPVFSLLLFIIIIRPHCTYSASGNSCRRSYMFILSLGRSLVTTMNSGKTGNAIKMMFGEWSWLNESCDSVHIGATCHEYICHEWWRRGLCPAELSYSTLGLVSTGIGDHPRARKPPHFVANHQANSASCLHQDGK